MTSKPDAAFVWFWLPGAIEPRVVGRLDSVSESLIFTYGRTYLEAEGAVSLFSQELPLKRGRIPNPNGLMMPGVIRDCSPDAWGRRVILNARLNSEAEIDAIRSAWDEVCDEAELDSVQRQLLWERQFLNPYSLR